jgi:hypothetical protein
MARSHHLVTVLTLFFLGMRPHRSCRTHFITEFFAAARGGDKPKADGRHPV